MTDEELLESCKDDRQECEVWTRVMGYFRNTTNFNIGKRQEYRDRKWFKEPGKETVNEQKRNA